MSGSYGGALGRGRYTSARRSVETRWREVVDARVAHKAPVCVVLHPTEGHVGGRRHVRHVQPQRDVREGGALHLVKCAGVAETQGEVGDAILGGPGVHRQPDALVGLHNDVASVHAEHHGTHPIDEAHRLVQVLGEDDACSTVNGHRNGVLRHHLAAVVVGHVALRVAGHDCQRGVLREEGGHCGIIQLGTGAPTDRQKEGMRRLRQDVGDVVLAWLHVHDVACRPT